MRGCWGWRLVVVVWIFCFRGVMRESGGGGVSWGKGVLRIRGGVGRTSTISLSEGIGGVSLH